MAERIAPGVHRLDLGWPKPLGANAFLLDDGAITLIDAGLPLSTARIHGELGEAGVSVGDIDRVLITHYDLDHVGGLARIAGDLRAPVYMGEADLDLIAGTRSPPLLHHKGLFHRGLRRFFRLSDDLTFEPVRDRDAIGGFDAFHTPGHNPGHIAYVHAERRVAFLGDLVWERDGALTIPIWLDSYDMDELRESVRRFATVAPPFELACVGHGDPLTVDGSTALVDLVERLPSESDWFPADWLP